MLAARSFMCEQAVIAWGVGCGRTEGVAVEATLSPDSERGARPHLASSPHRAAHYVDPTGLPLLRCVGLSGPHERRLPGIWLSITLNTLQRNGCYI